VNKSSISVEAIVSCDDRGQLVLPKDMRKKLGIKAGEKMALLKMSKDNEYFLTLIKADSLEAVIKGYLSPVMKDIIK